MKIRLALSALTKFLIGLLFVGLLLFLPAGSLRFYNAWLLIVLLFAPMLVLGVFLFWKFPQLLRRRLESKEKESSQKGVVGCSGILFVVGFVVSALDFRYGWSRFPQPIIIAGAVLLLASYGLYAEVMRENVYLSRTVKVEEGQTVVDTGLYGVVRHPMYSVTLVLFLSFSLVLGSLWSFLCFLGFIPLFILRILNEEKVLRKELNGYTEYCEKVKYRLVPLVW